MEIGGFLKIVQSVGVNTAENLSGFQGCKYNLSKNIDDNCLASAIMYL